MVNDMSAPSTLPAMRAAAITKRFPGVTALDGVDFEIEPGEVHALLGENGAGKSTLTRIIAGDYKPDGGSLYLRGVPVAFASPRDARRAGIRLVTQDRTLVPSLSAAENLLLGRLPRATRFGPVDWSAAMDQAKALLDKVGLAIDPRTEVGHLRPAQQQLVEIARALDDDLAILILDEPTAALSAVETNHLFELIRGLRASGIGILYISHRIVELAQIADRVTVLRDGRVVMLSRYAETSHRALLHAMLGREATEMYPERSRAFGEVILSLDHVSAATVCSDLSLDVRGGEIVAVFGLIGSGATEIPYVAAGDIASEGVIQRPSNVGLVPLDRSREGILPRLALRRNIGAPSLDRYVRNGVFRRSLERAAARRQIDQLEIRPPRPELAASAFSGGNQQKAILGRWLEHGADLLLLSEPTRGVDVGARAEIYAVLARLCEQGMGILLASSDVEEAVHLADRVLVMTRGRITAVFERPQISVGEVLEAATG